MHFGLYLKFGFSLCVLLFSLAGFAQVDPGQQKAVMCAACHGQEGISNNTLWPNLKGQKVDYLMKALKDFRSGSRNNELMSPVARTLSDDDISAVAHYFSKL